MIDLCQEYGAEYSIKYNEKKTECIKFGNNYDVCGNVYMEGAKLNSKDKVKHLGNILSSNLCDEDDIKYKKGRFFQSVNKVCALFSKLPCHVVNVLFNSYCTSKYFNRYM